MQNTGIIAGGSTGPVKADNVISKLKDDGDFDRLRLKIVRKLKDNEELRSSIMSMVKQSAALNLPGTENMKPRQLSDAIHQEIGDKIMSQISDNVWNIIRSTDGMKDEITETVRSVYDKLSKPRGKDHGESSSHKDELDNNVDATGAIETNGTLSGGEPNEPPGFSLTDVHRRKKNKQMNQSNNISRPTPHNGQAVEENKGHNLHLKDTPEPDNVDYGAPPGFFSVLKPKNTADASDEDPDVPPGFG